MSKIQNGYFFGHYEYDLVDYEGLDYSRRVFVFSGQGSAYPGMMKDIFLKSPIIQAQFRITDAIMKKRGYKPSSEFIQNEVAGSELLSIAEKNIALLSLQVGLFKLLVSIGIKPVTLTGHSFGEYASMVCSGILKFEDAVDILISRDNKDFLDSLGEMLAVRCSYDDLIKLSNNELFYISNINSNHQCVVSASPANVGAVIKLFKSNAIPCIRINIKYPYHCKLLEPALISFNQFIEDSNYDAGKADIAVLSSVNQQFISAENFSNKDLKNLLKNQMRNTVNFLEQIKILEKQKCINFIEIGPGRTLTDFIIDIDNNRNILKAKTVLDVLPTGFKTKVDAMIKSSGKFLPLFNMALNFVTGYEIDNFTIKDRMQEDLGIDSIRKAEIIFKVLEESGIKNSAQNQNVRISDLSTVDDVLQYFEHQYKSSLSSSEIVESEFSTKYKFKQSSWKKTPLSKFIMQLNSQQNVLDVLYTDLSKNEEIKNQIKVFLNKPGQQRKLIQFKFIYNHEILAKDFHLNNKNLQFWINNIVHFFAELNILIDIRQQDVFFQFIFESKAKKPMSVFLRSFLTSWGLEQGGVGCQIIELINTPLEEFKNQITLNHLDGSAIYIRYQDNIRYIESLVDDPMIDMMPNGFELKPGSHVVLLGGHSGIGWEITQSLDPGLNLKVVLIGRRSVSNPDVAEKLKFLKKKNIQCEYFESDARNESLFLVLIDRIILKNGPISLLVNTVGIVINKILTDCLRDQRLMEFDTKSETIDNVSKAFLKYDIKHVVSFSSSTGYFGNTGQAVYALANSYVDMVSDLFDGFEARGRFQSIRWPPWDKVGFITENSPIQSFINFIGLTYLDRNEGVRFFWSALGSKKANINILDDNSYIRYYASGIDRKAFRQFLPSMQTPLIGRHLNLTGLTLLNLPYLRDHCLSGRPIVAASNMIALFMQLGYVIWGQLPRLDNFIGHNFIFVDETNSQVNIDLERGLNQIAFKIKTSFTHSEAKISRPDQSINTIQKNIPDYKFRLDSARLRGTIIETIRSFEYTELFWVDPDAQKILLEFKVSDLPICTEMPLYDRLFAMIEICNQAVGLVAQWKTNQYSIPKSVGNVQIYDQVQITETLFSQQENVRIANTDVTADAYISNDRGEVIMYLKDVMFVNLNQPAHVSERFKVLTA